MANPDALSRWLDDALSGTIPAGVVAYCVNLYETSKGFELELVGAGEFDPDDSDWACDEVYTSRAYPRFVIPRETAGGDWNAALRDVERRLRDYLASNSTGAGTLTASRAVAVGFVDGELRVVWEPEGNAQG